MKIFLRILAGLAVLLIVAITALFIYLTDERLKGLVMPPMNEAIGREVHVDRISFTLFRTFPNFGLVMEGFELPDDANSYVVRFDELLVSVNLIPLLSNEINVRRLDLIRPDLQYIVYEDGTTNIDFLLDEAEEDVAEEDGPVVDINRIRVIDGNIRYRDYESLMEADLRDLDLTMSIRMAEFIETDVDASLAGLTLRMDGATVVNDLALNLEQTSELDLQGEELRISRGVFGIRGLALDLSGQIGAWSQDVMQVDLQFASSSEDFGALLDLVPDEYREHVEGIQTRGSLELTASVVGGVGEDVIPNFDLVLRVEDGFMRHPQAEKPVENVFISLTATNSLVEIARFSANADGNNVNLSGRIVEPLSDDPSFNFDGELNMDLATIESFYPISELGVELRGRMAMVANGSGTLETVENTNFNADVTLENGYLRYTEAPQPVEDIQIRLTATQDRVDISSFQARASANRVNMSGNITQPLDETRTAFDITAEMNFDLSTIKDFYPIDEDTLTVRGMFTFDGRAQGTVADAENANINGTLTLRDGFVQHPDIDKPIENIQLASTLTSTDIRMSQFVMQMGQSDFDIEGNLTRWRNMLEERGSVQPAVLTATYKSRRLNIDEFIDWEDETEMDPLHIELPNLETRLTARIDTLILMGITITNIDGTGETDTENIRMPSATANVFDGGVSGRLDWEVTRPDYYNIHFVGDIDDVRAEAFFKEFQMGVPGNFHNHITGGFTANADYRAGMTDVMEQDTPTIVADGSFSMNRARLRDHPMQVSVANLLNSSELRDMSLDNMTADFSILDGIMTLTDLNLTSLDIGMTMNGTQNMIEDKLDFKLQMRLPERYSDKIAALISADAVNALKGDDGILVLPLAIVGTSENPRVTVDREVVQLIVAEYLRKQGTDRVEDGVRGIFRGIQRN